MKKTIRRVGLRGAAYINRKSQITKKPPTKRLKSRRTKVVAKRVRGYFPNPTRTRKNIEYEMRILLSTPAMRKRMYVTRLLRDIGANEYYEYLAKRNTGRDIFVTKSPQEMLAFVRREFAKTK